jgi:hypothetical protein
MSIIKSCKTAFILFNSPIISEFGFVQIDDKVKELKKTHEWFLELASLSPEMREQLRHDISAIEHGIQVAISPFDISFNLSPYTTL